MSQRPMRGRLRLIDADVFAYAYDIWSEKIVFRDGITTALPANGATVQQLTSDQEICNAIAQRQVRAEYQLVLDGATVATGGLMFHYNMPYTDIYMETVEPFSSRAAFA